MRNATQRTRTIASRSLALALVAAAGPAFANPQGGRVVAGAATIDPVSPNRLDVTQSSERAIIDWQSFNIGASQWTQFRQPGAGAVTLNEVEAGDPSVIAGRLGANGSLVLINPSGVVFAKGAQVNVNNLVATSTGIGRANFMAGRMRFNRPSSDRRASVVNRGRITVAQHGLAALVAPGVANSGVIRAKLGRVVLAGAETYAVDFYGDGLVSFDVGAKVTEVPVGRDGKPMASLVANTGTIAAPGGTILLSADAAEGIVRNVVAAGGSLDAANSGGRTGSVTIDAGAGGAANLAGTIDVAGGKPGEKGGRATVTGRTVLLRHHARIDANGWSGGGRVMIGGGPHGDDARVRDAARTTVARGARIGAGARHAGNGGRVTVWSNRATRIAGGIEAQGGRDGGNGGSIETSGRHGLSFARSVRIDARAPDGAHGHWLLDPGNLTVTNTTRGVTEVERRHTFTIKPGGNDALVSARLIDAVLARGTSVKLRTVGAPGTENGNITIAANGAISWRSATRTRLTLFAAGNIVVEAPITGGLGAGGLVLDAAGNIRIGAPVTLTTPGARVKLVAGGAISQAAAGVIDASVLDIVSVGAASLPAANSVGTLAAVVTGPDNGFRFRDSDRNLAIATFLSPAVTGVTTNGGDITIAVTGTDGFDLKIPATRTVSSGSGAIRLGAGALFTNRGTLESTGGDIGVLADDIRLAGMLDAGGGAVDLRAGGAISQAAAGIIAANVLDIVAVGPVSLPAANSVGTLAFTVTGPGNGFLFRDFDRDLTLGFGDGTTVGTDRGAIQVATIGAGFDLTIPAGETVRSQGGAVTLSAAALFTNRGTADSAGGNIAVLADAMSLAGGTLVAGTGSVLLGPVSATEAIGLGTAPAAGALDLGNADLASVTASTLEIGYRNENGTPSLAGGITIAAPLAIDTVRIADLLLVTGGAVSETGGGLIEATGAAPLGLGVLAGGPVSLFGANRVATLAGFVDGAGSGFGFRNDGADLTIAALTNRTLGIAFAADGVPSLQPLGGPAPNPLSGLATAGGDIGVETTTSGNLTLASNIATGGGSALLDTAGAFLQAGAVTVMAPLFVVDTTGDGLAALADALKSAPGGAAAIADLPPAATANPIAFDDLAAPGSTVLLVAGHGSVGGTMNVGALGLSGAGGSASLFGSIAGVGGPGAALLGRRNPGPEALYLFNDCVIAAVSCASQPTAFLVAPPQSLATLTALVSLPDLAATVNFITPETVERRQPANPEEPVINIFDEERLCAKIPKAAEFQGLRCPSPPPR